MYNTIMNKILDNNIIVEKIKHIAEYNFNAATMRYLSTTGKYLIRGYVASLNRVGEIKVSEYDLLAVIYKDEEALKVSGLDDDTIVDLQILNYVFLISNKILKSVRIEQHKKRLGRTLTSVVELKKRKHNRIISGSNQNMDNYQEIYDNCVKKDRFEEFIELNKEWCKYNRMKFNKSEWVKKFREAKIKFFT